MLQTWPSSPWTPPQRLRAHRLTGCSLVSPSSLDDENGPDGLIEGTPGGRHHGLVARGSLRMSLHRWKRAINGWPRTHHIERAERHLRRRVRRRVLGRWQEACARGRAQSAARLNAVAEWRLSLLFSSNTISVRADPLSAARHLTVRWAHSLSSRAFEAWRGWTVSERDKMVTFVHRFAGRSFRWWFVRLRATTSSRRRALSTLTRGAARWRGQRVAAAWNSLWGHRQPYPSSPNPTTARPIPTATHRRGYPSPPQPTPSRLLLLLFTPLFQPHPHPPTPYPSTPWGTGKA